MAKKHQIKISSKRGRKKAGRKYRRQSKQNLKGLIRPEKSKKKRSKKMTNPYKDYGTKRTPQSQPIPGKEEIMVKGDAGGYVYALDKWSLLDRFLILGSEGGTYYVKEQKLTADNAKNVIECIEEDGVRTVNQIAKVSLAGRAPKNTPALFALALATWKGDTKTRKIAYRVLPDVARTGYHLLMWAAFTDNLRGTGSGWQRAVGRWFNEKNPDKLAYQVIKYQQREGWAMSDLLRLSHVKPVDEEHDNIYKWIVDGWDEENWGVLFKQPVALPVPDQIWAHEHAKRATEAKEIVDLIDQYKLPRESIPTQFLNDVKVWEALLPAMPMMAMLRNLGKMTSVGVLSPFNVAVNHVVEQFGDVDRLRKSRLHPLAILVAQRVYASGKGMRGSLEWKPIPQIVDVLNDAFYTAFGNITPTNKNIMLALDVSGSMTWETIAGMPITPRDASAAMALVTANVEPNYMVTAFSSMGVRITASRSAISVLPLSPKQRLDDVIDYVDRLGFGGTDCALPMMYAIQENLDIDTFIVYTDSETWAGEPHPSQALEQYRQKSGRDAKLIVVGMASNGFTIADPNDAGMLDVVGFDTAMPNLISEFSLGNI